jgi:hypothetical protein
MSNATALKDAQRTDTPTAHAARFKANPATAPKAATSEAQVTLTTNNGYFQLNWSASPIGTWDWIGLYQNASLPDSDYIGGDNWQWATRGSPYVTDTPFQTGYQARYLVWDATTGQYVSIARTAPWSA